jgi:serine/threonine protein kinase
MDSIQILIKYRIVHYDLKENNILIENTQQLPYIIDFGLSIDVTRLMEHPWSDKQEESSKTGTAGTGTGTAAGSFINSEVLYRSNSSKIFQHNYLWRQHFYVHAPDYFLWPIEVHIITYLIHEHDTLTDDSLGKICYDYVLNNKAFAYMSGEFKKKMFRLSVATFSRFIHQPREKVINELLKYWDKWDMYAINIMFLKIVYEMVFHKHKVEQDSATATATATDAHSRNEHRQQILDPKYSSDASIIFKNRYKIKLKQKYNNQKIMNTIQVMLRNIHPNPDKRMTPQETKAFFVSIFYEC